MRNKETSHFWLGYFRNPDEVGAYFEEIWDENDEDRDHTPLSAFARDQGEKWYDHDFFEVGFKEPETSLEAFFRPHSYSEQWAAEIFRRAPAEVLAQANVLAFINEDQIDRPRSVQGDNHWMHYLGTITYDI